MALKAKNKDHISLRYFKWFCDDDKGDDEIVVEYKIRWKKGQNPPQKQKVKIKTTLWCSKIKLKIFLFYLHKIIITRKIRKEDYLI